MDVFEQEGRLIDTGFNADQAREIVRFVTSGDNQAMTRADGHKMERAIRGDMEKMEQRLIERMDTKFGAVDAKFESIDVKFEAMDAKLDAVLSKVIATVWTVGGVAVGILVAVKYFG